MNSIRSSKGVAIGVLFVVALAAMGTATAVSVEFTDPEPAQVGDSVENTATVEEPFREAPDQWTLQGETELGNASWTVQVTAQGDPVTTEDYSGQSFTHDLDSANGATQVEVTVSGDVTAIGEYDYENFGEENYTVMSLARGSGDNAPDLQTVVGQRFTADSQAAREAIDSAIEANDGRNDKIGQAISSYNNGNFENAQSLAEDAESSAQSGQLILYAVIAVVVLALVGGGVYYWRQQQDQGYKLQ